MTQLEKHKVTYPLTKETLQDRKGGYYPNEQTLDRRCRDTYGFDCFYDKETDSCARYEQPHSKQAETSRYWFIKC